MIDRQLSNMKWMLSMINFEIDIVGTHSSGELTKKSLLFAVHTKLKPPTFSIRFYSLY